MLVLEILSITEGFTKKYLVNPSQIFMELIKLIETLFQLDQEIRKNPKFGMEFIEKTDKLLVMNNKKQRFGTILANKFDENNEPVSVPKPIEDVGNVDHRRAEYGLEPLEDYIKTSVEKFKKFSRELNA